MLSLGVVLVLALSKRKERHRLSSESDVVVACTDQILRKLLERLQTHTNKCTHLLAWNQCASEGGGLELLVVLIMEVRISG